MLWSEVPYLGPPDDNWTRGSVECRGLVLHIAEGSFDGTIAWMRNPASDVSSHFVIARDGRIAQMLDTAQTAWTQAAGNGHWISVENEGFSTQGFTAEQTEANAQLYAWLLRTHGIPAQLADSPSGSGLGWHGMGGVAWGNHPGCPGVINVALRPDILARAVAINGGSVISPTTRKASGMFRLIDPENGQFVISPDTLSETGWSWTQIENPGGVEGWALVAAGVGTANGSANDPNHDPHADDSWRPGSFGPAKSEVRAQLIVDIAAKVVASLPPAQGGVAPTLDEITAAVRAELDSTGLGPR